MIMSLRRAGVLLTLYLDYCYLVRIIEFGSQVVALSCVILIVDPVSDSLFL